MRTNELNEQQAVDFKAWLDRREEEKGDVISEYQAEKNMLESLDDLYPPYEVGYLKFYASSIIAEDKAALGEFMSDYLNQYDYEIQVTVNGISWLYYSDMGESELLSLWMLS